MLVHRVLHSYYEFHAIANEEILKVVQAPCSIMKLQVIACSPLLSFEARTITWACLYIYIYRTSVKDHPHHPHEETGAQAFVRIVGNACQTTLKGTRKQVDNATASFCSSLMWNSFRQMHRLRIRRSRSWMAHQPRTRGTHPTGHRIRLQLLMQNPGKSPGLENRKRQQE